MSEYFLVERDGPLTVVTINRAEAMNALDAPRHFALSELIDGFAADPEQRVMVLTGAGDRAFCAGNDLKQRLAEGEPAVPPSGFGGLTARLDLAKPVIAAVNGMAFGGGFEMALACDLIIAAETASFALPEVKVGSAASAGGLLRLPMHIGPKLTMEVALTGRRLSAREGKELGFVNKVVPAGDVLAAAREMAMTVCEAAPLSVRAVKAVVRRGLEGVIAQPLLEQLDIPEVREMRASQDAEEGRRAFAEKRPARWTGR